MRSIQTNPMIFMSDRLSVAFSFSRRAHLLTTCKAGGGIPMQGAQALARGFHTPKGSRPGRSGAVEQAAGDVELPTTAPLPTIALPLIKAHCLISASSHLYIESIFDYHLHSEHNILHLLI